MVLNGGMTNTEATTSPARKLAEFVVSDGDLTVLITVHDEPAVPTTTDERRFVVRVDGEAASEWSDGASAMANALDLSGWLHAVKGL